MNIKRVGPVWQLPEPAVQLRRRAEPPGMTHGVTLKTGAILKHQTASGIKLQPFRKHARLFRIGRVNRITDPFHRGQIGVRRLPPAGGGRRQASSASARGGCTAVTGLRPAQNPASSDPDRLCHTENSAPGSAASGEK